MNYLQELIGVLRWATEIGRVDILLEVSLLSQYQASPREGHLEQLLHIFAFLKKHPKLTLYLSPEVPRIDYGSPHEERGLRRDLPGCRRIAPTPNAHAKGTRVGGNCIR
jgi:hypothetical protein